MANHKLGTTFLLSSGTFIHVSKIEKLSCNPINTEAGVMQVLSSPAVTEPETLLYVLLDCGNVETLATNNNFNANAVGVDLAAYSNYNDSETHPEKVRRLIVKSWAMKHYPEHECFITDINKQSNGY